MTTDPNDDDELFIDLDDASSGGFLEIGPLNTASGASAPPPPAPPPLPAAPPPPVGGPPPLPLSIPRPAAPVTARRAVDPSEENAELFTDPAPAVRDRIVVIGRSQAGKTVYMARLYEQLWNSQTRELHMRGLSGPGHVRLMEMIEKLREGSWPGATLRQDFMDVEVTFARRTFRLSLLDYPGETFAKAFVQGNVDAADTRELVGHIDRAAGAILLIDPQNAVESRNATKRAEDDFAMQAVLHRIRASRSGENVPVALVLTKYDQRQQLIKGLGGLEAFARKFLLNVIRPAGKNWHLFPAVAVWTRTSRRTGQEVPDLDREPLHVVRPLAWVLKKIIESDAAQQRADDKAEAGRAYDDALRSASVILRDEGRSLPERIAGGSTALARAQAIGGDKDARFVAATQMLDQLKERLETRGERRFWIVLGSVLALIAAIAVAGTLYAMGVFG